MRNTLSANEIPYRKQITFDLSEAKLGKYFPKPGRKVGTRYYAKAWDDIGRFMAANDFEHIEYSVYASKMKMVSIEVVTLIRRMVRCMPWLSDCLKEFHVTNIVEQHDMMNFIKRVGIEIIESDAE